MKRHEPRRDDCGVTIVEAAFVLPILMLMVLGMVDLGFAGFNTSQATAAARDGARYGILEKLDVAGIEDEVKARLTNVDELDVDVVCLQGLAGNTVKSCAAAVRGADRIRVTVEWPYGNPAFVSSAAGIDTIRGVATMVIVDRPISVPVITTTTAAPTTTTSVAGPTTTLVGPTTTTAAPTTTTTVPGQCVATGIFFDPAPLELASNGKSLTADTTFTVETNGAATCTSLRIAYPAVIASGQSNGSPAVANLDASFKDQVTANEYDWTPGGANRPFRILNSSGQEIGFFTFPVNP